MDKEKCTGTPEITLENYRKIEEDAVRNIYETSYVVDCGKLEEYFRKANITKHGIGRMMNRSNGHIHALFGSKNKKPSPFGSSILEDIVCILNERLPGEHLVVGDFILAEKPFSTPYEERVKNARNKSLREAGFVNPDGTVMKEEDVIAFENREKEKKGGAGDGIDPEPSAVQMELFGPEMAEFEKEVRKNREADSSVPAEKKPKNRGGIADNSEEIVPALKKLLSALGMTIEEYAERSGFNDTDRDLIIRYNLITNRNADILRGRLLP